MSEINQPVPDMAPAGGLVTVAPAPAVPDIKAPCDEPEALSRYVEALLFVSDGPVPLTTLEQLLGCSATALQAGVDALQTRLAAGGVRLQRLGDRLQLASAPDLAPAVERFLGLDLTSKLSAAGLEVAAIVAYRQPITRAEIDLIRGVNSGGTLRTLLQRELIEEVGRLETVGHPIVYGTTFGFLQYFGLQSLSELPALEPADAALLLTALEEAQTGPIPEAATEAARKDVAE